jgi:hypothetical protein
MKWTRCCQVVCIVALLAGCSDAMITRAPPDALLSVTPVASGLALEAPMLADGVAPPSHLFISGHSLVDRPYPDQLAALAERAGTPLRWNRLYLVGSSIKQRSPPQMPEGPYDALLITEQHGLLGSVMWNQTEQHLRQWHEALRAQNPQAVTYFYVPWLSIEDKDHAQSWVAYEKAAAHVWQCVVTRVNAAIAQEGRSDRILTLPASLALVHLIERLQAGAPVPGVTGATVRESLDRIIADNVHLTPLGSFYLALVSHLALASADAAKLEPLLATPVYAGVTAEQARSLLEVATGFLAARAGSPARALEPEACRRFLADSFIEDYWEYTRRVALKPDQGWLRSTWGTFQFRRQSRVFFSNW